MRCDGRSGDVDGGGGHRQFHSALFRPINVFRLNHVLTQIMRYDKYIVIQIKHADGCLAGKTSKTAQCVNTVHTHIHTRITKSNESIGKINIQCVMV